jgi:hypothetical protein
MFYICGYFYSLFFMSVLSWVEIHFGGVFLFLAFCQSAHTFSSVWVFLLFCRNKYRLGCKMRVHEFVFQDVSNIFVHELKYTVLPQCIYVFTQNFNTFRTFMVKTIL